MQDYTITGLTVNDVAGINNAFQAVTMKHVTFYVGRRGPFYLDFAVQDYSAEAVMAGVQKEIETLKQIDAGLGVA